jgi:DNA-binding GntR family transcriptional regulator
MTVLKIPQPQKPIMGGSVERALQRLLMMIMCGELSPGEQIRQQEMAGQFGLSRVPLREALNVLAKQGLLVHRPNKGYFVAKRGPGDLAQIRRMLHLLENEVMRTLQWPAEGELAQLRAINDCIRSNVEQEHWAELLHLNREFHNLILALSPFQLITDEIRRLVTLADPFFGAKFERASARARTVQEHDLIISALALKDRSALMKAVEAHRYSNAEELTQTIADQGSVMPSTWDAAIEKA